MLKAFSVLIDAVLGRQAEPAAIDDRHLLAAGLIAELAAVDGRTAAAERDVLLRLVTDYTGLAGADAEDFLVRASQRLAEMGDVTAAAADLRRLPIEERRIILSLMWRVALADGTVHEFEEDLIERAGALLGVPVEERAIIRATAADG